MNNRLILDDTECPKCNTRYVPRATFDVNFGALGLDVKATCTNEECGEEYFMFFNIAELFLNSGQLQPMTRFPERE